MHEAIAGLLERADLAVASARPLVDSEVTDRLAQVASSARTRLLYPEDVVVVALAGGTGSGKSSLFNLLTETDRAEIGVARPTTSHILAGVPSRRAGAMEGYLDQLGVTQQVVQEALPEVCLLDLPDTDSVESDHRFRVEAILPRVDVMVWVVDPEKYRDASLHHRYLQPLAGYASQFLLVLNQIDRLAPGDLGEVIADLELSLLEDGLGGVPVLATSAAPSAGPPIGVERLAEQLNQMTSTDLLYSKLLTDLDEATSNLSRLVGSPLDYRDRAGDVVTVASTAIADGDRSGAVDALANFVDGLAEQVGPGPLADRLRLVAAGVPEAVQQIPLSQPVKTRWWRRRTPPLATPDEGLVQAVLAPAEELVVERGRAAAVVADLALSVRAVAGRESS